MKTCNKCNTTYPDDMRFCKKCGGILINSTLTKIKENSNTTESTQSYNKMNDGRSSAKSNGLSKSIFLIIGIISTAVILIAVYFIFLRGGTSEELEAANKCVLVSNENITKKTELTYSQFDKQFMMNRAKVRPYYEKAMQAKKITDDLTTYIENFKKRNGGSIKELQSKIENYKSDLLIIIDPKYRQTMDLGLNRDKYNNNELELNSLIGEVKNAEFNIINNLLASVSLEDFKFDRIGAKVIPKSNNILTGETFEADVFVAAYDTKQNPKIIVGSEVDPNTLSVRGEQTVIEGEAGVGKIKIPGGSPGLKKYGGIIKVKGADGVEKTYPFNGEYIVALPSK